MKESKKLFGIRKLWWLIALVLFVAMTSQVSAKPKNPTVKSLTQEAATAYDKENYDEALDKFEQAYNMIKDSEEKADKDKAVSLRYNLGRVCQSKGDLEKALEHYRAFVTSKGADETATRDALERIEDIEKIQRIKSGGNLTDNSNAGSPAPAPKGGSSSKKAESLPSGQCIDINNGALADLKKLNGVGEKTAQTIIDSRNSEGAFKSVDDLARIKGLGPKKIDKLRDQVCPISGGAAPKPAPAPAPAPAAAPNADPNAIDI